MVTYKYLKDTRILHTLICSWKAFFKISTAAFANYGIWMTIFSGLIAYSTVIGNGLFGNPNTPQPTSGAISSPDQQLTSACMVLGLFGLFAQSIVGNPDLDAKSLPRACRLVENLQRLQVPRASVFVYPENRSVVTIGTVLLPISYLLTIFLQ